MGKLERMVKIMVSFYSKEELKKLGIKEIGENVFISKKASIYSPEKIKIGNNVRIDDFCILSGDIEIGDYVHIAAYVALYGKYGIKIGDFCGCSARCTIYSATDDFSGEYMISPMVPEEYTNVTGGRVILEKFAQLGANTVVMPNITIKEGTSVGAMSFVNKDLEEWGIYAGIPCRKIKERKRNIKDLSNKIK